MLEHNDQVLAHIAVAKSKNGLEEIISLGKKKLGGNHLDKKSSSVYRNYAENEGVRRSFNWAVIKLCIMFFVFPQFYGAFYCGVGAPRKSFGSYVIFVGKEYKRKREI